MFLPGLRRPRTPAQLRWRERYAATLAAAAGVALVAALPLALRPGAAGPGSPDGFALALQGLVAAAPPPLPALLEALFAAALLLLHPTLLVLAPALWLLADEERAAKGVLIASAVFLALAAPLHLLQEPGAAPPAPLPFLADVGALYYARSTPVAGPGIHAGLALCVALAARRSRASRFRPLAFAYPFLLLPALLHFGVSGLVAIVGGAVLAGAATLLAERAVSVERIAQRRVDASPERKMEVREAAEALVAAVRDAALARGLDVEPRLVGSVAKDTYLAHRVDLDVFALFPPETPRSRLEEEGLALGRAVLEAPEARYAEHPYLAGRWRGLDAEVVPAYRVPAGDARMSAVDRTPFHTDYVLGHLEPGQRRDVRLLKQFLLGVGVYGADAKVQGFSGYLAELLVLKHGRFRRVLRAGANWRVGQLLALEPFEGVPRFDDPLVVIDPVDPGRNAAAAVSLENLLLFQEAARAYLREPRLSFFFPRPVVPLPRARLRELLRKRGHGVVALRLGRPDVPEDALHAQLRKCGAALAQCLERAGFKPLAWDHEASAERCWVALELESVTVNEREVHLGPPVSEKEHADRFREKWTGHPRALSAVYEEGERLAVVRRREFTDAAQLLKAKALELDLGKDLTAAAMREGFEVLGTEEALAMLDAGFLTRFLQRVRPWER